MYQPTPQHQPQQQRALYILSPNRQNIHSDNTRLIITAESNAPRPIPFQRINRIISGSNAHWSGQAIVACINRNIPIIWLDHHHQPIGDTHPLHSAGGSLHHALQNYTDLPDWPERYANWLKSRRMDILNRLQRHNIHTRKEIDNLKRDYVHRNQLNPAPAHLIRATLQSVVNQQLAEHHTRARYWGDDGHPLEIAHDLESLITAEYHLENHWRQSTRKTAQETIHHLENWLKDNQSRLHEHLGHLHKHLANENQTWR